MEGGINCSFLFLFFYFCKFNFEFSYIVYYNYNHLPCSDRFIFLFLKHAFHFLDFLYASGNLTEIEIEITFSYYLLNRGKKNIIFGMKNIKNMKKGKTNS